jgi:TetR/AcrR family transcriptional regulator, transcriptional repressor for nem operon
MNAPISVSQLDLLVETGARIFHERGYAATGVRQVAAAAGVPEGSFTNHFRSKEAFGIAVLEHYTARLDTLMQQTLGDVSRHPAERLAAYFEEIETRVGQQDWGIGCLIPDLAAETSSYGDSLRNLLASVLERQTASFAVVLKELVNPMHAADLSSVLLAAWHGTLLRMKVERTREPIVRFRKVLDRLTQ